ncbi:hypothetical protein AB205_0051240 [Aquarana catesbeiana]|uniref:Fibronectin type-III domain-containing protein n=1 Tax=Aquarana catesbeiana TaxID=8400 RepID=A0A2G9SFF0_AQUCT|nr:hypothetical protein AB205_0051240 [Aquarana catesbeiana]
MNTTLTWMPPENAEGVFYTVSYLVYGSDIWHSKLECTNITWTWCNLAHETNKNSTTYGNVTASYLNCSISEISEGFEPYHQTILTPPKINLFSTATSIVINLTHPIVDYFHIKFKYHIYLNGIHIKETECHHMPSRVITCRAVSSHAVQSHHMPCRVITCCTESLHVVQCHHMPCRVITCRTVPSHAVQSHHMPCRVITCRTTPYYIKEHLDSHTKYCITAKLSVFGRESSMSGTTCITTERGKKHIKPLWLPIVIQLKG